MPKHRAQCSAGLKQTSWNRAQTAATFLVAYWTVAILTVVVFDCIVSFVTVVFCVL